MKKSNALVKAEAGLKKQAAGKAKQLEELLRPLSDRQLRALAESYAVVDAGGSYNDSIERWADGNEEAAEGLVSEANVLLMYLKQNASGKLTKRWFADLPERVAYVRSRYPQDATELPVKLDAGEKLTKEAKRVVKKEVKGNRLAAMRAKAKLPPKKEKVAKEKTVSVKAELEKAVGKVQKISLYGKTHSVEVLAVKGSALWFRWPESANKKVHRTKATNLVEA